MGTNRTDGDTSVGRRHPTVIEDGAESETRRTHTTVVPPFRSNTVKQGVKGLKEVVYIKVKE